MDTHSETPGWTYRMVRHLIEAGLRMYFRRIEIAGLSNVPPDGAVLFCGNHGNSLIDPMLIICRSGRQVRFAAADVVFDNAVLRFFLTRLHAVPVRRRQDHGGTSVDNQSAFDTLFEVLAAGGAMGIFPEGKSHSESDLAQFRTGPARIALGAKNAHPDNRIFLVPCGFYYSNPNRFRSSVLLHFGAPIEVTPNDVEAWKNDERTRVRQVTDTLEAAVRDLTVTAEDWETIRTLDLARRLYQPARISLEDRVTLARRFNAVYPHIADNPKIREALDRIDQYANMLDALNMKDSEVRDFGTFSTRLWAAVRLGLLITLLAPPALLGAPIHAPLLLFVRWGGRRFAPREDVVGTTKLIAGLLLTLTLYGMTGAATFLIYGLEPAIAVGVALPVTGASFVAFVRRIGKLIKLSRLTAASMLVGRGFFDRLQAQRSALVEEVDVLVTQFKPDDMERLFAPVHTRDG